MYYKSEVFLHQRNTSTILSEKFSDKYFDFIYIDGDHGYNGAKKDLVAAVKKIKDNGYIAANDYCLLDICTLDKYGVIKAVNEICLEHNFEMIGLALQAGDFYDVLLRKTEY